MNANQIDIQKGRMSDQQKKGIGGDKNVIHVRQRNDSRH